VTEISNSFGLSARQVINAANHNYPRSAISIPGPSGGPCLEKDPWILYESAASVGVSANIIKSARLMNENMIVDFLNACLDESAQVYKATILGLAFKGIPETLDTRGSHVRQVCQYLKSLGIKNITGYEPAGVVGGLNDFLIESTDLESSIIDSDLVIILTNSRAFLQIENSVWNSVNLGAQILDFWGVVSKENLRSDIKLRTWG
jgi:UDP-N-acetyl-D-mannosaminuronate dehydrogenase